MARIKIDYGIDLGTTNSSICRMEKGEPKVIRTDLQDKVIMPSCVSVNRKGSINVGDSAYNTMKSDKPSICFYVVRVLETCPFVTFSIVTTFLLFHLG